MQLDAYPYDVEGSTNAAAANGHPDTLHRMATHPLACLLNNPGIRFHQTSPGYKIGYFSSGNADICIGGLIAPAAEKQRLLDSYLADVRIRKANPVFVHFPKEDAPVLNARGFCVNQLGASYTIYLPDYDMSGKRFQQLRNKIHRAVKAGVTIQEIKTRAEFVDILPSLQRINKSWLAEKGSKPLKGLVTDFESLSMPHSQHRLVAAFWKNQAVAYVLYTRTYGAQPGWFHDLSRKIPDVPDGVMQLINSETLKSFQADSEIYLHFGFTPLVEMDAPEIFKCSRMFGKVSRWMARHGGVVYPAASQRQYKMSWRPQNIEHEYIAFAEGKAMKALWSVLKATNSI